MMHSPRTIFRIPYSHVNPYRSTCTTLPQRIREQDRATMWSIIVLKAPTNTTDRTYLPKTKALSPSHLPNTFPPLYPVLSFPLPAFSTNIISSLIINTFQQQKPRLLIASIINNNKLMFYQFTFDTQAHLDSADFSEPHDQKGSLPTTTHNSPHHSDALVEESEYYEASQCSFEENSHEGHATAIWQAAGSYLGHSSYSLGSEEEGICMNLEDAVQKNALLRQRERSRLMGEVRREAELCGLLSELLVLFSVPAFQEVLFLVHNVWQRHYLPFRTKMQALSLPRLSAFTGWEGEEQEVHTISYRDGEGAQEVARRAEEGLCGLSRQLFYSKKLRLLAGEGKHAEARFHAFLQALSKSLFLSAEGFYAEQEWRCEEEMEWEESRPVRAFSQIQMQHSDLQSGRKLRKLE